MIKGKKTCYIGEMWEKERQLIESVEERDRTVRNEKEREI